MSRHTARRRALEILFSREFHDTNDIQYSETEILSYAEDEKEPIESAATVETVTADCLDAHAVPFVSENEVLGKMAEDDSENDTTSYCEYLVSTVSEHGEELNDLIRTYAKGWDLGQMNKADKTIMKMAFCEFVYPKEKLASAIIINEAVLLAKQFGGADSSKFVNGILGAYARTHE